MSLSAETRRQLHAALLAGFPTREALDRLVFYGLGETSAAVAGPTSG